MAYNLKENFIMDRNSYVELRRGRNIAQTVPNSLEIAANDFDNYLNQMKRNLGMPIYASYQNVDEMECPFCKGSAKEVEPINNTEDYFCYSCQEEIVVSDVLEEISDDFGVAVYIAY